MKRSNPVRCLPIHDIASTLLNYILSSLIAFHSLAGCDTTSQFSGIGRKRAWKTFTQYAHLLAGLGKARDVSSDVYNLVELFVAQTHYVQLMKTLDRLPPTKEALTQHVGRVNYQSQVRHSSLECNSQLPLPHACSWKLKTTSTFHS